MKTVFIALAATTSCICMLLTFPSLIFNVLHFVCNTLVAFVAADSSHSIPTCAQRVRNLSSADYIGNVSLNICTVIEHGTYNLYYSFGGMRQVKMNTYSFCRCISVLFAPKSLPTSHSTVTTLILFYVCQHNVSKSSWGSTATS